MGDVVNFVNPFSPHFLGAGGKQQTQSSQQLQQGSFAQFPDLQKAIAQAGWGNIENISPQLQARLQQPASFTLPGGTQPASSFESLLGLVGNRAATPFQFPQLSASGLFPQQEQGFQRAVTQALGQTSGDFAQRGFLRPENINAIAGSAAQNVMPQFANLIGQNVTAAAMAPEQVATQRLSDALGITQAGFTAALSPEQVMQNRINQMLQLVSQYPGLLGGIGTQVSSGQTNFPSFMQTFATSFAKTLGGNLGSFT